MTATPTSRIDHEEHHVSFLKRITDSAFGEGEHAE